MVGTITGRDNKPHLARFHEENIEIQSEYEFWNGSGWAKDNETAAVPLFDDIAGELSVAYHPSSISGYCFISMVPAMKYLSVQLTTLQGHGVNLQSW